MMFSWAKALILASTVGVGVFAFDSTAEARPRHGFGGYGGHAYHGGFHVRPYANYRPHFHASPYVHRPRYEGQHFHVRPYANYRPHLHLNPYVHRPSYDYGW